MIINAALSSYGGKTLEFKHDFSSPKPLLITLVEDMRQGVTKIRNHVIARVFKELNLIEQWGSRVRRIFREAQELGLPEPQIVELGLRATEPATLKRPECTLNLNKVTLQ